MKINRLKLLTLGMLAVGAITLWASGVKADQVIYSQPLQTPLVDAGGFFLSAFGFQTADTFTLAQGASIDSLQWFGSYENGTGVGFPTADATGFQLFLGACLASDCLTHSDAQLLNGFPMTVSPSTAHETFLGTSSALDLSGVVLSASSNYGYQVNFSTPVQLTSGEYFLLIFPELPTEELGWSFDAGTGGDGISQGPNPTRPDNFDLAFTLHGTPAPVPEPSGLLLLAMGLAIICLLALRARRLSLPLLVLLAFACWPVATHADSFTLDGANIDSFSFNSNSNVKTLSVMMAASDAQQYLTDDQLGTKIDLLALDEFLIVDGTLTLDKEIDFLKDTVKNFQFVTGSDKQLVDVTFTYTEFKIIKEGSGGSGGGDGGGGNTVPEPSSVALLASGLLGLIGFGRKKLATAGGGGRSGC